MPKIIPNVRGKILAYVKQELLAGKSRSTSVIDIAAACKIATGTVFNYFDSKDMIFATIILEDWNIAVEKMKQNCAQATSACEGIDGIYAALKEFVNTYSAAWKDYTANGEILNILHSRHGMLRDQIAEIVSQLPLPESCNAPLLAKMIAENLIWLAMEEQLTYDDCKAVIRSLFSK